MVPVGQITTPRIAEPMVKGHRIVQYILKPRHLRHNLHKLFRLAVALLDEPL